MGHTVPQAPQFMGSVIVVTHWPLQRMVFPGQEVVTHIPFSHD
jgi:hypothetical protein